ncbi:MAG TPA: hypothetical protein VFA22_10505 [Stellaceae bacterium]|nr:hypothetical protein [Stellaceae bacterium]
MRPGGFAPAREDVRQAAYAAWRHAWRLGFEAWLAAGRPDAFMVGERDGCRRPPPEAGEPSP